MTKTTTAPTYYLIEALRSFMLSKDANHARTYAHAWLHRYEAGTLTEGDLANAGRMIERFAPEAAKAARVVLSEPMPAIHPNRFVGTCRDCDELVPAGEGRLDGKDETGRHIVRHLDGQCPVTAERELAELLAGLEHGKRFALPCIDNRNDFDHVLVATDGQSIKRFIGGGRWGTESVERQLVWARALAGLTPEALEFSAVLFGRNIGACCDCGRPLEKDDSRAAGRGPDCAKKRAQ